MIATQMLAKELQGLLSLLGVTSVPEAIVEVHRLKQLEAHFREWFPANYQVAVEWLEEAKDE